MTKKRITYVESIAEIEQVLDEIEHGELDVDILSEKVKRVSYLLKFCNDKLKKTQADVENVLTIIQNKEGK